MIDKNVESPKEKNLKCERKGKKSETIRHFCLRTIKRIKKEKKENWVLNKQPIFIYLFIY